jgi:hypothetical protein
MMEIGKIAEQNARLSACDRRTAPNIVISVGIFTVAAE